MQTRRKNKQKANILTDQEQLNNLKDELHVPGKYIRLSTFIILNNKLIHVEKIFGLVSFGMLGLLHVMIKWLQKI